MGTVRCQMGTVRCQMGTVLCDNLYYKVVRENRPQ